METKKSRKKAGGRIAVILLIIAAAVIVFGGYSGLFHSKSIDHIGLSTKAAVDSITIKWRAQDNIDYYELYRKDITEGSYREDETLLKLEDYESIARVNGEKRAYKDTDVAPGHTYAYVISGFRKRFGHMEQVCTSFIDDSVTYETAGLAKPGLFNDGGGENHENSTDALYLYCEVYEGMEPDGVEVYRKSSTDPEYAQLDLKRLDSEREILDDTVTSGETYTYKVRTFAEQNGKKYYSPYSDEVTIPAVNLIAAYDVETIDRTDDVLIIKLTSGVGNGTTTFDTSMPARYTVKTDARHDGNCFSAELIGWNQASSSSDDQWQAVPEEGVSIKADESICLKYKLSPWDEYDVDVSEVESTLFMDETDSGGAKYYGSGSGCTIMTLDLLTGKGRAYCDWDY